MRFHRLLDAFLYGRYHTKRTRLFYPFVKTLDAHLLSGELAFWDRLGVDTGEAGTIRDLAVFLGRAYRALAELGAGGVDERRCLGVSVAALDNPEEAYGHSPKGRVFLELLANLRARRIERYVRTVCVHGSFGSQDYLENISDLDMLVIVRGEVFRDAGALLELHAICHQSLYYFYRIDVLQHHGYFVLTDYDLEHYPIWFFPPLLFEHAKALIGEQRFRLRVRPSHAEERELLHDTVRYLRAHRPSAMRRMYDFKLWFQVLQLLPIVHFQAAGRSCYKRDSFEPFVEVFPESRVVFDLCREHRMRWSHRARSFAGIDALVHRLTGNPNWGVLFNAVVNREIPSALASAFSDEFHRGHLCPLLDRIERDLESA